MALIRQNVLGAYHLVFPVVFAVIKVGVRFVHHALYVGAAAVRRKADGYGDADADFAAITHRGGGNILADTLGNTHGALLVGV